MSKPQSDPTEKTTIDAFEFVREPGREARGAVPVARLVRLAEGQPMQTGQASWQARSERGPLGEPLIRLHVQADVVLECQRCLTDFVLPVESEAVLHVVHTEEELEVDDPAQDDDADDGEEGDESLAADDAPERVLGSRRFDLLEQVEDELILCVPYVPRHEVCPAPLAVPSDDADDEEDARPSPFAVLAQLKTPKH